MIANGQFLSKVEATLKEISSVHEVEEIVKTIVNLTKNSTKKSKEKEDELLVMRKLLLNHKI